MRKRTLVMMSVALTMFLMLLSCSQPPEEKIQMVTDSFEKLEAANAKDYATEAFERADETYSEAMAEVEAQKEKSVLTRSYSRAEELLNAASEAIQKASAETEERRGEVQEDASRMVEDAKAALKSAEDGLAKIKVHSGKVVEIRDDFEESGALLNEAERAFDAGDFLTADAKATDAKAQIEDVLAGINEIRGS
jgi:hypothetical protein